MAGTGRPSNEDAPRVPGEERSGVPWGRIIAALIALALLALLIPFACQALRGGDGGGGSGAGDAQDEQGAGGQEQGAAQGGETTGAGPEGAAQDGGDTTATSEGAAGGQTGGEQAQGAQVSAEVTGGEVSGGGTTVPVPSASISGTSGWLVVHADDNGEPGAILGHAPLPEGTSEDVAVPLDEPAGSSRLFAMVHADDPADDRYTFPDGDPPVGVDGNVVVEPIRYTVSDQQAGEPLPSSGGPSLLLLAAAAATLLAAPAAVLRIRRLR